MTILDKIGHCSFATFVFVLCCALNPLFLAFAPILLVYILETFIRDR